MHVVFLAIPLCYVIELGALEYTKTGRNYVAEEDTRKYEVSCHNGNAWVINT
jgi:hypothetical protein